MSSTYRLIRALNPVYVAAIKRSDTAIAIDEVMGLEQLKRDEILIEAIKESQKRRPRGGSIKSKKMQTKNNRKSRTNK